MGNRDEWPERENHLDENADLTQQKSKPFQQQETEIKGKVLVE